MPFIYNRTVRLPDTDAAGVVYFANGLSMCHEAYEASLEAAGISLQALLTQSPFALPITHASIDFFRPMMCGDRLEIALIPEQLQPSEFLIQYTVVLQDGELSEREIAKAVTYHVCIETKQRHRRELPEDLVHWLNTYGSALS
jgi:1,4-dihydroxy-2-naphthoyl-CoA hydrolase